MSDGKGLLLTALLFVSAVQDSSFTITLPTFEKGGQRFEINARNEPFKIDTGAKEISVYPGDKYICEAPSWLKRFVFGLPKAWQCEKQ